MALVLPRAVCIDTLAGKVHIYICWHSSQEFGSSIIDVMRVHSLLFPSPWQFGIFANISFSFFLSLMSSYVCCCAMVQYIFTSFLCRDAVYDTLKNVWKNSKPTFQSGLAPAENGGGLLQQSAFPRTSESSLEATSKARFSKRARLRRSFLQLGEHVRSQRHESTSSVDSDFLTQGDAKDGASSAEGSHSRPHPTHPTECEDGQQGEHFSTVVLDETYPTGLGELYNLLFKSDFLRSFLVDNQGVLECEVGEWKPCQDSAAAGSKEEVQERTLSFIKPINAPVGPKSTQCLIREKNCHYDLRRYTTHVSTTQTPDVPSGGSFSVATRTCLTWAGGWQTRLHVTCQVDWSGRSFLRSTYAARHICCFFDPAPQDAGSTGSPATVRLRKTSSVKGQGRGAKDHIPSADLASLLTACVFHAFCMVRYAHCVLHVLCAFLLFFLFLCTFPVLYFLFCILVCTQFLNGRSD